jgi:predicted ATPase
VVVIGDLVGSGDAQERGVVGETPNLAARLQAAATPGTIAIDTTTHSLVGGLFEYRDLGGIEAKGFANPVHAYEVVRPSVVESRFEALRTATTPLDGREEELGLLLRRWEQAKRGDGCVVLISGEPGIGNSRITETVVESLSSEPHTRLRYFCSPHHQDSALYPSIGQLERAANLRRNDTAAERLQKLEALLAEGTNDLTAAVPLFADLLGIPIGDRYTPLDLTPQKRKEKTLQAQLAQVEGLSARNPVLMVFEDIHWSDPTTRESLDLLVDRASALRVLVILTFRPEFSPSWVGRPQVTLLTLNHLPPKQRAEMITYLTGGKALPREIAVQIAERTDGVPLFIEELTKSVIESGIVAEAGSRYTAIGPAAQFAIPTTLHASLLARLDRLAPTREVAQIGAALGRSFSHELISAVAQIPQEKLDEALEQLVSAELIYRRGTPPDAEYTFKHALVQDTAYGTLLRSRRQQFHGRIAAVMEGQFPEIVEAQPEMLAQHCAQAGLTDRAVGYWLKAGRQAIARGTMTEAAAQLRKGLEILSSLPDTPARREQELNLQIELGHALVTTMGYSAHEPGEAFARARELCAQLGEPAQLGQVLYGQLVYHVVRGELVQAERQAGEYRRLAQVHNDQNWQHASSHISGALSCVRGKFTEACAYFENAVSLWDPKVRAFVPSPEDPYVGVRIYYCRALLCLGHIDQAILRINEALAEARRISPFNTAYALNLTSIGYWAIYGKESAEARLLRAADEVLAISNEHGFPLWSAAGKWIRGRCLGAIGQGADGVALIVKGLAEFRAVGCNLTMPFVLTTLAETYGFAGQPEEGLKRTAEAIALFERTDERWAEAETFRVHGTFQVAAEDSFQKALTVARRQSAKFWELRAAVDLARLWRDQGKRTEARNLLAPVYGWFTEGLDKPVLQDAKSMLDTLA